MAHTSTRARHGRWPVEDAKLHGATKADRQGQPKSLRSPTPSRFGRTRMLNVGSAVLILIGGYVHFCLYRNGYRFIPKIGVSFVLQFVSSAILAGALLVRLRRVRLGHFRVDLAQLARLAAIGLSVGDLAALGIAHTSGGLFNFREIGLRPAPQTLITIVVESLAAILLAIAMLQTWAAGRRQDVATGIADPSRESVREAA
jgi:hypothetical protein